MTDIAWVHVAVMSVRPKVLGALLCHFRDLDSAEEALQEAGLQALRHWPQDGPPRDPAAWLGRIGRSAALDDWRRRCPRQARPPGRPDDAGDRDDVLGLLFACCHPDLPAVQQIVLALRMVCGLSVKEIARAFLVGESIMERRIARARRRAAADASSRTDRLGAIAATIHLLFNEGHAVIGGGAHIRAPLCAAAIRLARLLVRLVPGEPEVMGLAALLLFHHGCSPARLDAHGGLMPLEDQDRGLWDREAIGEGLALMGKAMRHGRPGPYQLRAAIAAEHARAARPEDTDWAAIDRLHAALERVQPSPMVTLDRAVAVAKIRGAAAAFAMIEPLASQLSAYFHFFGVRGALLTALGQGEEARRAFGQAIALANSAAEAAHIRLHLDQLIRDSAPGVPPGHFGGEKAAERRTRNDPLLQ